MRCCGRLSVADRTRARQYSPGYFSGLKSLWLFLSLQAPLHWRPHTLTCTAAQHKSRKTGKILKHLVVKSKCLENNNDKKKIRSSLHRLKHFRFEQTCTCGWGQLLIQMCPGSTSSCTCTHVLSVTFCRYPGMKFDRLPFHQQTVRTRTLASRGWEPARCGETNGAPVTLSGAIMSAEGSLQSRWFWWVSASQWEVN